MKHVFDIIMNIGCWTGLATCSVFLIYQYNMFWKRKEEKKERKHGTGALIPESQNFINSKGKCSKEKNK